MPGAECRVEDRNRRRTLLASGERSSGEPRGARSCPLARYALVLADVVHDLMTTSCIT